MTFQRNRRFFQRINFNKNARITVNQINLKCQLIDLSLRGALLQLDSTKIIPVPGSKIQLNFALANDSFNIQMKCRVAHHKRGRLGVTCTEIDVESISHLRRLVELNVGNASILDLELLQLTRLPR